jgi:glycosyltransferase involved in cell wall biosynthesis
VRTLRLEQDIRFLGQLPHDDVIRFYRTKVVSCTVLASLIEGIPVSLMEAMSYGVPVVATAVGGVPELLGGGCGIIVPPRNAEALADGIASILQDGVLRSRLAQAGRRRIEEEYSATRNAETLGRLLTNSHEMRKELPALSAR